MRSDFDSNMCFILSVEITIMSRISSRNYYENFWLSTQINLSEMWRFSTFLHNVEVTNVPRDTRVETNK